MFVFMVSMSNAQDRPPRRPPMLPDSTHVVQMVDQMFEELSLTEAQKTQIINLQLEHFKQMKAIMKKDKAQHEKTRAAMDSLRDDMKKQMNDVLTDKQQKQFKEFMESHRPPREERPEPRP
jgi:Spy/CpxP family protein refolding chaperone